MKHSECPIRQTAVTHVGGADARWETSGPVRRTEILFFSQQKEISSANNPSTRAHSSMATIAFRTSCQFCCSYEQIPTEISHLNSPMWKIPPAGHLQVAKNVKYFTKKTFSLLIYSCTWMFIECWGRCVTETSAALVGPVLDQYEPVWPTCSFFLCHSS